YLADDVSVQRLVRDPAGTQLEFADSAVERIAYYSAGNPYYGTQICMRLYEDLITRRDHYASVADVERSVESICAEESVSTFQHFWKDGIFTVGAEAERFQQLNALVLLACAAEAKSDARWVPREALTNTENLRRFVPEEVRYRLDE